MNISHQKFWQEGKMTNIVEHSLDLWEYNVRSVKKHTKHSSVLLLCLVCLFTERTLPRFEVLATSLLGLNRLQVMARPKISPN